jgi:hypothetical protein
LPSSGILHFLRQLNGSIAVDESRLILLRSGFG